MTNEEDMKRMIELKSKKESLKSKRLGKKEAEELRQLVKENGRLFLIFSWDVEESNTIEEILNENNITHEKVIMPEDINLKFF